MSVPQNFGKFHAEDSDYIRRESQSTSVAEERWTQLCRVLHGRRAEKPFELAPELRCALVADANGRHPGVATVVGDQTP